MWTRGAAAAAVLLAVLVGTWAGLMSRPRQMAVSGLEADVQLEELMDASRTLERVMRTPGSTPAVLGAPEAARIAVIEDRIAAIDAALDLTDQPSERSRELALWSGRVELLDELIQVRNGYADRRGFARTSLVEGSFQ